jgi:hypothetical protein
MLGIAGFLDFVHRPIFQKTGGHSVSETGAVTVLRRRWKAPIELGPLGRANLNQYGVIEVSSF